MARRRGHNGYGQPPAPSQGRKLQTKTAADVAREQAEREALLKGTDEMRRALNRPGSLFKLTHDVCPFGSFTALQRLVRTPAGYVQAGSPGMREGAVLVFAGRGRANDEQGINRPVHLFMVMGLAARFVVADFTLIQPVDRQ